MLGVCRLRFSFQLGGSFPYIKSTVAILRKEHGLEMDHNLLHYNTSLQCKEKTGSTNLC